MPSSSRQSILATPLQTNTAAQRVIASPPLYTPRQAVLLLFCDPMPTQCLMIADLSHAEWRRLLHWLDISGLALYFLERLRHLNLDCILPSFVLARLKQNQTDNTARTHGMIAESIRIQTAFQRENVVYAILKGISLCPVSVQRPELRHQFDLDFLVAAESADTAKAILFRQGYRLYAQSGRSLEFKRDERPAISMRDFYKDQPGHSVELHVEANGDAASSRLARAEIGMLAGMKVPVLSPVDLFVGQGLHVYKDVCSEFCRTSHLLEFRRHILARSSDVAFWRELEIAGSSDTRTWVGLGVATQFITKIMGQFAPEGLTRWTVDRLPASVQLWSTLYANRSAFANVPGTKFYLLLQRELEGLGLPGKRSITKALLPLRLPPPVTRAAAREPMTTRFNRYSLQSTFLASRFRFHVMEGMRYVRALRCWREHLRRLS
ncbi:hypothetical protein GOB94_15930 [Granulicella sp. 5B5]|uniref:nucleotidyltransferase family protein n=1 Tax=Granulicella sp. 5B5 TaxID=1617967 RepID=UPI0015F66724|nr:nucleotidyltransferase family protein [Granulicella sp. 5B5]QMV20003.1 hypothetical protein GOB94_15930 [Granulicella sp. 5B5]